jgi:hypothetical protein
MRHAGTEDRRLARKKFSFLPVQNGADASFPDEKDLCKITGQGLLRMLCASGINFIAGKRQTQGMTQLIGVFHGRLQSVPK